MTGELFFCFTPEPTLSGLPHICVPHGAGAWLECFPQQKHQIFNKKVRSSQFSGGRAQNFITYLDCTHQDVSNEGYYQLRRKLRVYGHICTVCGGVNRAFLGRLGKGIPPKR